MISEQLTIPTYMTLARLCGAPIILPLLFVYLLPFNNVFINGFILILFVIFSLTDFLDGFLARRYFQETELGKVLDPIADKFLMYSSFVGLLAAHKIFFLWVIIFIGRDFFIMGLRQIASKYQFEITVSQWGKVRTALVMVYVGFVIANPYQQLPLLQAPWWHGIEATLLLVSLMLTIWSAYSYYCVFIKELLSRLPKKSSETYL
jgi:CDP-diacylglycerol---glycerol-3-phosphate 3-phosphatidyltransferase